MSIFKWPSIRTCPNSLLNKILYQEDIRKRRDEWNNPDGFYVTGLTRNGSGNESNKRPSLDLPFITEGGSVFRLNEWRKVSLPPKRFELQRGLLGYVRITTSTTNETVPAIRKQTESLEYTRHRCRYFGTIRLYSRTLSSHSSSGSGNSLQYGLVSGRSS